MTALVDQTIRTRNRREDRDPTARGAQVVAPLAIVLLLAACSATPAAPPSESPEATPRPTATPRATVAPSPDASPSPIASSAGSSSAQVIDLHDAPELEALLPSEVAGRPLYRWSAQGVNYLGRVLGLTDAELATAEEDLAIDGLVLDDLIQATAGRDSLDDPPYFVIVLQIRGYLAQKLGPRTYVDHPEAGEFEQVTIGGKQVWRGVPEMVEQTEHLRGTPYVYLSGEYGFAIVTDDPAWAADAIAQLP